MYSIGTQKTVFSSRMVIILTTSQSKTKIPRPRERGFLRASESYKCWSVHHCSLKRMFMRVREHLEKMEYSIGEGW